MPAEGISNSLEDLGFNVINVRQMTATWGAPDRQIHMETLPLFLVTLTRNIQFQEIYKLNSLNHIIIKVQLYRIRLDVCSATIAKTLAMFGPNVSNFINVCGVVVATSIGNVLKRQIQNLCWVAAVAPYENNLIQRHPEAAAMWKETSTMISPNH
jgi:hypothetical protein